MSSNPLSFLEFQSLFAKNPGFLWEDALSEPGCTQFTLYSDLEKTIHWNARDESHQTLDAWQKLWRELEEECNSGKLVSGYLSYELGAFLQLGKVPTYPKQNLSSELPLLFLQVFRKKTTGTYQNPSSTLETVFPWKKLEPSLGEEEYTKAFQHLKREMEEGNSYQCNFTFPWIVEGTGDPFALYQELKRKQKTQYSSFFRFAQPGGEIAVLSLSPELFWEIRGNQITVQPMKGTTKRGRSAEEDLSQKEQLLGSEKEKAENLMIVDLLRNDLGRFAEKGSVKVPELFQVQPFESVWQMTSKIEANIPSSTPLAEVLLSIFPSGSVTGAPKRSSMKILSEVESFPRGIYTGAIFRLESNQGVPFSIANVPIRTLVMKNTKSMEWEGVYCTGSGLTVLSDSHQEYRECFQKIEFLKTESWPEFSLLETILCYPNRIRYLELHLERLEKSARFFSFPCPIEQIRKALQDTAQHTKTVSKVRLFLTERGGFRIQKEDFARIDRKIPVRISLGTKQIPKNSAFFFHKTTERKFYQEMLQEAQRKKAEDALLFSESGLVAETTIRNLFYKWAGQWFTPSLTEGGLAGVLREFLIRSGKVKTRKTSWEDLKKADLVLVGNSLRGLQRVLWNEE